jgi:DNA repair exonuclease SbcCD ATPase subunit
MAKSLDDMLNKIDEKIDNVSDSIHKIDKEVALQKAAFDEQIKQDEKMYEEFKRMNDILQQNTDSLKEHMHRTDLLETMITRMDQRLSPIELERIEDEAVKKYRNSKLKKYGKVLGAIATAIGILAAVKPLLLKLLGL